MQLLLLRYELRFKMSWSKSDSVLKFGDADMEQVLIDKCLHRHYYYAMNRLEISNAGRTVLVCRFSYDTIRKDTAYTERMDHNDAFRDLELPLFNRIKAKLMAYERQEFEYREIEL